MASQIDSLTIVYSTFIQAQIKENIKAPSHLPFCGEFIGDRWIPRTNVQERRKYIPFDDVIIWGDPLTHSGCDVNAIVDSNPALIPVLVW